MAVEAVLKQSVVVKAVQAAVVEVSLTAVLDGMLKVMLVILELQILVEAAVVLIVLVSLVDTVVVV